MDVPTNLAGTNNKAHRGTEKYRWRNSCTELIELDPLIHVPWLANDNIPICRLTFIGDPGNCFNILEI